MGFESTSIILDIDSNEKKIAVDENVLQIVATKTKLYQEFLWASSPQASYWILTAVKKNSGR